MPSQVVPGTLIDRYRMEAVVGAGSMGDVFRGVDVDLGRNVALKILSERHRDNDELRARFVREARAVAAISHPNVVQVFTTGTWDDRPFIAMEFLDGVDLGTAIEEGGPWTSLQAARAVLDSALGLRAAADAGLIHRDVKPSNLVLLQTGAVKVTDFGLAKPLNPGDEPALTAMGVVVGTPDYIAPEQARGDAIDERVDIYALGGTLYFLLVGKPPFRTGRPADDKYLKVVARHLRDPAPDPRTADPRIDRELGALALRMMAKKAVDRPAYDELIEQLAALVERLEATSGDVPRPVPRAHDGSGGRVAPTPFVGGRTPTAPELLGLGGDGQSGHPDEPDDAGDAAPTRVKLRTQPPLADSGVSSLPPLRSRASRPLVVTTVLSALVFATGLGLLLFGPMPEAPGPIAAEAADAGIADTAPPPDPEPPEGMFLLRRADGAPWLLVDVAPVTHGQYADMFPNQKKRSPRLDDSPVTGVSYGYADAYARARERRLLSADEWHAAAAAAAFQPADALWEWVEDGGSARDSRRAVRRAPDRLDHRRPNGHRDVTFRTCQEL